MHIIHVAAEFAPLAKTGGLGDAVFGLAEEQLRKGHRVTVIIPCYGCLDTSPYTLHIKELWVKEHRTLWSNRLWHRSLQGLSILLVDTSHSHACFKGTRIYRGPSDVRRFLFFSKIVYEFLQTHRPPCDILHIHDWHTALIPYLLAQNPLQCKTIFTIHNMKYQGRCHPRDLRRIGLSDREIQKNYRLCDTYNPKRINLLRAGLEYADHITTVSCRYAEEIASPQLGCGLDRVLHKHRKKFTGITNGIDYTYWSPAQDTALVAKFAPDPQKIAELVAAKQRNKEALCQELNLILADKPLVVVISRLVSQKGPQLIIEGLRYTEKAGGLFVILGAVGEPQLERPFSQLQEHYRDHPQVSIQLQFNEALSRRLFASADCILVPSLFEPCGLTQMIALRYGTLPIVRKTGGLADTIIDPEEDPTHCTGIVFEKPQKLFIHQALQRAFDAYTQPQLWQTWLQNGLQQDFSWTIAERSYAKLYSQMVPSLQKAIT